MSILTLNGRDSWGRPTRESIHMRTALLWAERSQDPRLKVGAIITTWDMTRILSIGYNGPARGLPASYIRSTPGDSGCIHAESNAIAFVDSTIETKVMFVTNLPCEMCAQMIVQAKIIRVVYLRDYRIRTALDIFKTCGVSCERMTE